MKGWLWFYSGVDILKGTTGQGGITHYGTAHKRNGRHKLIIVNSYEYLKELLILWAVSCLLFTAATEVTKEYKKG